MNAVDGAVITEGVNYGRQISYEAVCVDLCRMHRMVGAVISSDLNDGTLATAPSIILIVCIVGAIAYTGFSAAQLWMISDKHEDGDEEDDFGADDVDESENSSESDGIKLVNAL